MTHHKNAKHKKRDGGGQRPHYPPVAALPEGAVPEHEPYKPFYRNPDFWTATFTGCLIVVGVATAWVLVNQLKIFHGQLDEARKQTRATETQMRQDQRPWLYFELPAGVKVALHDSLPVIVPVMVKNTGKTPALDVHAEFMLEENTNGQQPTFDYPWPQSFMTTGLLQPGQDTKPDYIKTLHYENGKADGMFTLTPQQVKDLQKGNAYLIFYARVTYVDTFQVHHWTNFCHFVEMSTVPISVLACTQYNSADTNQ